MFNYRYSKHKNIKEKKQPFTVHIVNDEQYQRNQIYILMQLAYEKYIQRGLDDEGARRQLIGDFRSEIEQHNLDV